jgi:hypothetical protein
MVSHTPGPAHHNPEHPDHGPDPGHWPVNSANRFDRSPRPRHLAAGHRHLVALRVVHDCLAGRGVAEAVRRFGSGQLVRAASAGRYFDLDDLADLLCEAPRAAASPDGAAAFDEEYQRRFVAGTVVSDAVSRKMAQVPGDFPD